MELMTIGAFAERTRLSAKALRLYDRLGLLVPARVDRANGYRLYGRSRWSLPGLSGCWLGGIYRAPGRTSPR